MPDERDQFDGVIQAEVEELAPGMTGAIVKSLRSHFDVTGDVTIRTVLESPDGFGTVRWSVDCTDTIRKDRYNTYRDLTVRGLSMVGSASDGERVVTHYIDWAGVMGQLGMTTSRPSAIDPSS